MWINWIESNFRSNKISAKAIKSVDVPELSCSHLEIDNGMLVYIAWCKHEIVWENSKVYIYNYVNPSRRQGFTIKYFWILQNFILCLHQAMWPRIIPSLPKMSKYHSRILGGLQNHKTPIFQLQISTDEKRKLTHDITQKLKMKAVKILT